MLFTIARYLPLAVVLILIAMKYGIARFARFEVIGPKILDSIDITDAYSSSKMLCVGCTTGIGQGIAQAACDNGAHVFVVGRRDQHFECASKEGKKVGQVTFVKSDLSSMEMARSTAQSLKINGFDTVVFTVGITAGSKREESKEGIEMDNAVSFLSRYVMSEELIPSLKTSKGHKLRVFIMGFPGAPDMLTSLDDFNWETKWTNLGWDAHMQTVIGNDALVGHLTKKYKNVNVYGLNPGLIKTDILSGLLGQGSILLKLQQTVIGIVTPTMSNYIDGSPDHVGLKNLLVSPLLENMGGSYFNQIGEPIQRCAYLLEKGNEEKVMRAADKLLQRKTNISYLSKES